MRIYNTLSGKKEELVPLREGEISMYVCGPTVYNFFHIGNARPLVVFDTMRRYLQYRGYKVKYVQNFTDVDDKIINRAREEGCTAPEISEKYIEEYFKDTAALNVKKADVHPKVSEHIPEIMKFVKDLVDKSFAYEADGDVYFSTRKFPEYGKLSGQNIDDLESGARIAIGEVKKDPLDFALWKGRKEEGEIAWESPWGMGRPGWHIECSAMAKKHLGATIDIHAGGQDLQFPHHENEIAQSECCNGAPFARYWMHNAYITMNRQKMSKSKGNFFTVRDIRKTYTGEEIRFFLLSGHYRSPIDFGEDLMKQARASLERLHNCKENLLYLTESGKAGDMTASEKEVRDGYETYRNRFIDVMDDDLNTADGISVVFELVTAINSAVRADTTAEFAKKSLETLMEFADVLGILQAEEDNSVDEEIRKLVDERQQARKDKNFARADEIRDMLRERGITLKDTPQGVQIVKE